MAAKKKAKSKTSTKKKAKPSSKKKAKPSSKKKTSTKKTKSKAKTSTSSKKKKTSKSKAPTAKGKSSGALRDPIKKMVFGKKCKPFSSEEPNRFITKPFRSAFIHVFKPAKMNEKSDPKYDVQMLFPKKDTDLSHLFAAIQYVFKQDGGKYKASQIKVPIRDGDKDEAYSEYESHKGMWVVTARSDFPPSIIDYPDKNDIIDPSEVYSGCWGRASVTAYWYDNSGNKGVSLSLNSFQKLKDDEPFTGQRNAADEFEDAEELDEDEWGAEDDEDFEDADEELEEEDLADEDFEDEEEDEEDEEDEEGEEEEDWEEEDEDEEEDEEEDEDWEEEEEEDDDWE